MAVPNKAQTAVAKNEISVRRKTAKNSWDVFLIHGTSTAENKEKAKTINLGFAICKMKPWTNPIGFIWSSLKV